MSAAATSDAAHTFEARAAWWSAVAMNALVLWGALDRLVSEGCVPSVEMLVRLVSIAFSLALLATLLSMRRAPRARFAFAAWFFGILPFLVMLPILGHRWDATHRSWEPLFREKLALFMVAALAPPRAWLGVAGVGLILGTVVIECWPLGLRHSPYFWPGDPWRTFFYGAMAMAIAWKRGRDLEREQALLLRQQEALVLERLARVALAVHDMTNTPLQTLVVSAAILERDPAQSVQVAAGMVRAVEKLKTLNDALSTYQSQIEWRPGDESFDPRAVIASAGRAASPRRDSDSDA